MIINCIVIEDEPLALQKVTGYIKQIGYLNLLQEFSNATDAIAYLKTNRVDLIFLDIRMKNLTGIQLLESLQEKPLVIITSAYDEYALKGYELNVSDYLLKPFSFERFVKSVEKVYALINAGKKDGSHDHIFVRTENRIEQVGLDSILYIKGMKDYLQIVTTGKKIMTLQSFRNILKFLPEDKFIRVHNSYVVAISKIESIERNRIKIGNETISVSGSYKEGFYDILKQREYLI